MVIVIDSYILFLLIYYITIFNINNKMSFYSVTREFNGFVFHFP